MPRMPPQARLQLPLCGSAARPRTVAPQVLLTGAPRNCCSQLTAAAHRHRAILLGRTTQAAGERTPRQPTPAGTRSTRKGCPANATGGRLPCWLPTMGPYEALTPSAAYGGGASGTLVSTASPRRKQTEPHGRRHGDGRKAAGASRPTAAPGPCSGGGPIGNGRCGCLPHGPAHAATTADAFSGQTAKKM
jgi:hypothetical protein